MRSRRLHTAAIAIWASLLNTCDDATRPPAPVSVMQAVAGGEERLVTMMDAGDPESFDAADVTCVRPGGVTFERFLGLLGKNQTVGAWRFSPVTVHAGVGQTLLAVNRGGEVHTFTEVEDFGGGIVDTPRAAVTEHGRSDQEALTGALLFAGAVGAAGSQPARHHWRGLTSS